MRSRSSMALRVPPVKNRARTLTSTRLPEREEGPLEVGRVHPRVEGRGCEHGAVLELTDAAVHRLVADEDGKERGGPDALGRGGAAPRGHLDEGVGPALARGAGQLVDPRGAAQALFGLGTVGLEEVVLEPVELAGHDGARDGVEGHLAQPHAREAGLQDRRCVRPCAPRRRPRPRRGRPAASNTSRAREKSSKPSSAAWATSMASSRAMEASVRWRRAEAMARACVAPDGTVTPGLAPQRAGGAGCARGGPGAWRRARETRQRADEPRGRRLGPVGRPLLPRLEGRRGLGDEGLETRQAGGAALPWTRRRRSWRRPMSTSASSASAKLVQLHVSMEARGCDTFCARNDRTLR